MLVGKVIVWLIVGSLAGTWVGRAVTFKKEGLGRWKNIAIGMLGAVVGGLLFHFLKIDLGLGELKVTFEDLIAAVTGSLICVCAWWLLRRNSKPTAREQPAQG
jgi:uncharacterized membrane protein YeaQ/YmgE (transglycosylase-associated protein family)